MSDLHGMVRSMLSRPIEWNMLDWNFVTPGVTMHDVRHVLPTVPSKHFAQMSVFLLNRAGLIKSMSIEGLAIDRFEAPQWACWAARHNASVVAAVEWARWFLESHYKDPAHLIPVNRAWAPVKALHYLKIGGTPILHDPSSDAILMHLGASRRFLEEALPEAWFGEYSLLVYNLSRVLEEGCQDYRKRLQVRNMAKEILAIWDKNTLFNDRPLPLSMDLENYDGYFYDLRHKT